MKSINPRTVHRKLLFRISITGLLIALLVGIVVWQIKSNDILEDILLRAEDGFDHVNREIRHLLIDPTDIHPETLQRELTWLMSERRNARFGRFVWIGIYTLEGQPVSFVKDEAYEHMDDVIPFTGRAGKDIHTYKRMVFDVFDLEDIPHIHIIAPMKNELNRLSAYGETVFAVSSDTLSGIRRSAVRLAIAAMVIVILTTALLYPVIVTLLNRVSSLSVKLFDANLEILKVLGSAVAKRDSDTDSHNYRVTLVSVKIAEALGLTKEDIQQLIKGAFLHDVGKIGVEDKLLHKPGRLNEEEFALMKKHVNYGLDIINSSEWIRESADIVGHHHDKYDGSGYIKGLKGDQIPMAARIFAIADVFDALTSKRPYKEPFSYEKAMDILESGRGSHFDPECLDAFVSIAPAMFNTYAGKEDDQLKQELDRIIQAYFYE